MIGKLAAFALGPVGVAIGIAVAAMLVWSGGVYVGHSVASAETERVRAAAAEVARLAAEREAQALIEAKEREIARLELQRANAALIAANAAKDEQKWRREATSREEQVRELAEALEASRVDRPCDCRFSPADRRRLQSLPIRRPPPAPRPDAGGGAGADPGPAAVGGRAVP